jgi:cytochrome c
MSKSLDPKLLFGAAGVGFVALAGMSLSLAGSNVAEVPDTPHSTVTLAITPVTPEPEVVADATPAAVETEAAVVPVAARGDGAVHGLGRVAHADEIAAWDVDVLPDGRGLPAGSGDVWTGEELFLDYCASCHGDFAEGAGNWPPLAGGEGTLADEDPVKTVGSYWPYLSTVWDYVHRSMPFGGAGTLSADDTYAITAYILYSNFLVEDDFVLSKETFLDVAMPNADGFIVDDRAETEYTIWSGEPCMENCKDGAVEITRSATDINVTPDQDWSPDAKAALLAATAAANATANEAPADGSVFGLGRAAHPEEITAWDVDVLPDGRGLPVGSGDVWTGEELFLDYCASCHGDFAEGAGNWPPLAGGEGTLADEDPVKTVGSYWPYLSTVWDYVHRSMPFGGAGTLTADETYAITAYILYSNFLVEDDFTLSNETFMDVAMPNADGFIVDDRAETEYTIWSGEPCMENCKDGPVTVTKRATDLNVTPGQDHSGDAAAVTEAVATEETAAEAVVETAAAAGFDAALAEDGEKVYRKCQSCHQVGDGAKNRTGPVLTGIVGAPAGAVEGFRYSNSLEAMAGDGLVWSEEELKAFLADPKGYMAGTKMSFAGLRKEDDLDAVVEYLKSYQ